jgi:hypothetical protein
MSDEGVTHQVFALPDARRHRTERLCIRGQVITTAGLDDLVENTKNTNSLDKTNLMSRVNITSRGLTHTEKLSVSASMLSATEAIKEGSSDEVSGLCAIEHGVVA